MSHERGSLPFRNVYGLYKNGVKIEPISSDLQHLESNPSLYEIRPNKVRKSIMQHFRDDYARTNKVLRHTRTSRGVHRQSSELWEEEHQRKRSIGLSNSLGRLKLGDYRGGELITKIKGRALLSNPDFHELTADKSSGFLGVEKVETKSSPKGAKTAASNTLNLSPTAKMGGSITKLMAKMTATDFDPQAPVTKVSKEQINQKLLSFERRLSDLKKLNREDLKIFVESKFGFRLSEQQAVEGIVFCRGRLMERSSFFEREKLIDWLFLTLPILKTQKLHLENQEQEKRQLRLLKLNEKDKEATTERPFDIAMLLNESKITKGQKNKLVQSLSLLDSQIQEERATQGFIGQMAAQQRLSSAAGSQKRENRREIQRQIQETCKYESAVRALNLQRNMTASWSELPNSYKVVSRLDTRQKRRLAEMMHKRLEFPSSR